MTFRITMPGCTMQPSAPAQAVVRGVAARVHDARAGLSVCDGGAQGESPCANPAADR